MHLHWTMQHFIGILWLCSQVVPTLSGHAKAELLRLSPYEDFNFFVLSVRICLISNSAATDPRFRNWSIVLLVQTSEQFSVLFMGIQNNFAC